MTSGNCFLGKNFLEKIAIGKFVVRGNVLEKTSYNPYRERNDKQLKLTKITFKCMGVFPSDGKEHFHIC